MKREDKTNKTHKLQEYDEKPKKNKLHFRKKGNPRKTIKILHTGDGELLDLYG